MVFIIFIFEIFKNPVYALLFAGLQNSVVHILMLYIIFTWMGIKAPRKKMVLCGLCGMLLGTLPVILANFLISDPIEARIFVYRFLIYANPLYCIAYYFFIRWIFRFSPTRSSIIMHNHMLLNYIITSVYMCLNDFFSRSFHIQLTSSGFFLADYLSCLLIIGLWMGIFFLMKEDLKRTKKYMIIPPNYTEKNVWLNVAKTFAAISFLYFVILLFRIFLLPELISPLTFTSAFVYFLIIMGNLLYLRNTTLRLQLRLLDWEMQATGTYISSLLHANQEFRGIKHDFYNVLQVYGGYLAMKDYQGLEKYHQMLFHTTKQAGDFLHFIEILRSRMAVYSLLKTMSEKAKKADVALSINLVCDVTDVSLNDLDLCRVLSIVIDNAIEEAQRSDGKQVNLSFDRKGDSTIVFVISNPTKEDVDVDCIFNEGYTTKSNHTGIGLSKVMQILNSYEHCSVRTNYHDYQFTIFLILHADKKISV